MKAIALTAAAIALGISTLASADEAVTEYCAASGQLAHSIAKARDRGVPLEKVLEITSEGEDALTDSRIAVAVYANPGKSPDDSRAEVMAACFRAYSI